MFALRHHSQKQFFATFRVDVNGHPISLRSPSAAVPTVIREEYIAHEARGDLGLLETHDVVKLVVEE